MKKPAPRVAKPVQIQPKSQFLFHKNLMPKMLSRRENMPKMLSRRENMPKRLSRRENML